MTLESSTDRIAMLADFGSSFTFSGQTFKGIFDHEYIEVQGIDCESPVLLVKDADVVTYSLVADATITSPDSVDYKIVTPKPDGTGWTTLILEEQ